MIEVSLDTKHPPVVRGYCSKPLAKPPTGPCYGVPYQKPRKRGPVDCAMRTVLFPTVRRKIDLPSGYLIVMALQSLPQFRSAKLVSGPTDKSLLHALQISFKHSRFSAKNQSQHPRNACFPSRLAGPDVAYSTGSKHHKRARGLKMKREVLLLASVLAFLCPTGLQAEVVHKVINLGTMGGNQGVAYSINDAGLIVGWAQNGQGLWRATLFDRTGAGNNRDLGTLGGDQSWAWSINDAGQIVGEAENSDGWEQAALFDSTGAGNNIDLGTLGVYQSGAFCINDVSQIVGWAQNGQSDWRATLCDETGAGNNLDLGTLAGDESSAWFVNDAGQVVGRAEYGEGTYRATLFDPTGAGNNLDLGTLGGDDSWAWSINDAGQIVGEAQNSQGDWHAALFDATGAGNNLDLGTLGGDNSRAHAINDAGLIVGKAQNSEGLWRATLFDPTGTGNNIDLNTLIGPTSGWTLMHAYDINASGWIVGEEIDPQGGGHAFLLVPEPATFALLVCGVLWLRRRRSLQAQSMLFGPLY